MLLTFHICCFDSSDGLIEQILARTGLGSAEESYLYQNSRRGPIRVKTILQTKSKLRAFEIFRMMAIS